MKTRFIFTIFFGLSSIISKAQTKNFSKLQIQQDLEYLTNTLNNNSSYVYLNGYDFKKDFKKYQKDLKDSTRLEDFGLFLTKTIGEIGDRHSSVRDFEIRDSIFLPFSYAPHGNKVLVLNRNAGKELELLNTKYPYLKKIDEMSIDNFLKKNTS